MQLPDATAWGNRNSIGQSTIVLANTIWNRISNGRTELRAMGNKNRFAIRASGWFYLQVLPPNTCCHVVKPPLRF